MDHSNVPQTHHSFYIEGASNFRRIDNTRVYGIAQPTVYGLKQVIRQLLTDKPRNERILWINLREEPIIYINGIPYVLRDRYYTLRNIRAYKGITGSRLEQLEERLKEDIIQEISNYEGRILLHGENQDGQVFAQWEEVSVDDVLTVRDVMESMSSEMAEELEIGDRQHTLMTYHRIPITAEKVPTYEDLDELRTIIATADLGKTALIMYVARKLISFILLISLKPYFSCVGIARLDWGGLPQVQRKNPSESTPFFFFDASLLLLIHVLLVFVGCRYGYCHTAYEMDTSTIIGSLSSSLTRSAVKFTPTKLSNHQQPSPCDQTRIGEQAYSR